MDPSSAAYEWTHLVLRWLHLGAGIMWIGHLWFFNFVNAQLAKTYTADTKKAVVPELMPRALYWFRWGAAWTWISGFLLLGIIYYMGGVLIDPNRSSMSVGAGTGISIAVLIVGFAIYDQLWKGMAKQEVAAAVISFVFLVGLVYALRMFFSGRAVYIQVGALFGTIMAANVWMRIWPNQKRILTATKGGSTPEAGQVAMAGLRSKHNTYLSIPLALFMVSNHFGTIVGADFGDSNLAPVAVAVYVGAFVLVGWGITKFLYVKSATPKPAAF